ncbi:hypothetical protein P4668_03855 [Priestia megaterium]|uniref:hypothetical protein n=1 Tax=Priestia megaterium TaxID=1404 RepID=UPI002E1EF569|nr:hypothetical protein [Priestia megaterium]
MNKKAVGFVYALLTVIILSACSTEEVTTNHSDPQVSVSTTVKPLTKKEFSEVEISELTSPSKQDFRKVHVVLTLRGTDYLSNIQVKLPNYKQAFNNMKDDQQIKDILATGKIKTSWVLKDTKTKNQEEFAAGKNMKFEAK